MSVASAEPVTATVVNEPEAAEDYTVDSSNVPAEVAPEPVAVDPNRPLRRKKT